VIRVSLSRALAAAVLAAAPAAGVAQQAGPQCDIDDSKPKQIGLAGLTLQRTGSAKTPAERQKLIRDAAKLLGEMKTAENPTAQAWMYGQSAVLWLQDPATPDLATRGDFGLAGDKAAPLDLLVFADSVFKVVEEGKPNCRPMVSQWRAQQAWFRNIQAAFNAIGSDPAKAEQSARRSLIINTKSAYGPYIIGAVSQQRMTDATAGARAALADSAIKYYGLAVQEAGTDSSYADIKRRSLLDIGRIRNDQFEAAAAGDFKKACAGAGQTAAQALGAFLADNARQPDAFAARATLVQLHLTCQDTAKAEGVYDAVVADPVSFGDIEATQAGVTMTRINRQAKAAKLFEGALQTNPFQRDALNNLSATLYNSGKYAEMFPVVARLVAVDPNNPDNWLWYAYAYQGLAKPLKNTDPKKKAFSDSLVYYNNISETLPLKVTFNNFTRGQDETRLAGMVEFRVTAPPAAPAAPRGPKGKAAPKPAAPAGPAPKDVTLRLAFLDKSGTAVDSAVIALGALKAGESKDFTATSKVKGVVAYKYAKLD
jgi:tetratricopeptide (TPR) repeat protein